MEIKGQQLENKGMIATGNERPTDLAFIVIYKKLKDNKRRLVKKCGVIGGWKVPTLASG